MRFALFGLMVFAAVPAHAAGTGSVEGTVFDATSGRPLAGVQVVVDGARTTTDARGEFLLGEMTLGTHDVVFRDASGNSVTQSVDVSVDSPQRLDIAVSFGVEEIRVLEKAPAPPATQPILRRGSTTVAPLPRTDELIDTNRAAVAWLMATVDAEGSVADARVMKAPRGLDAVAVAEAKTLRFSPAMDAEGKPTLSHVVVKVQWEPYWSRLMNETSSAPCQGEGPLNLALNNPTYRVCDTL